MKVLFADSSFWKTHNGLQQGYKKVVEESFAEVRRLLPAVSSHVTFVAQAVEWAGNLVAETGEGAFTYNGELILLFADPRLPHGETTLLENTSSAVFHELNHSARFMLGLFDESFVDGCIFEGLATVFAREHDGKQPWGKYDSHDAEAWLQEIIAKGDGIDYMAYKFHHPDGRCWIGYKVGTYVVDLAMKKSGKSIVELTALTSSEIKQLAGVKD
ncbi:MAG TPA: DUF2268 domain-containing putative Zn-dependent protease [Candidatus Saccharimonadales bacterium]|jgi:uncharacterized protein YjaZ